MITVIITVHPPLLKYLARCIDSVRWQLTPDDQLLVVYDRCGERAEEEVNAIMGFRPGNVMTLNQAREVQSGEGATRNLGLQHAAGEWVKFLDADDLLAPFALEALRRLHAKGMPPEIAVIAGAQIKVHNGVVTGTQSAPDIEAIITQQNPIVPSMTFVRRAAANAVNGFDEQIDFEGDWDFWLRLRRAGQRFAIIAQPVCYYWIEDVERSEKENARTHQVEGMDVREYFAKTYGIKPIR